MLNRLKGQISAQLLGARSHRTVSQASLIAAVALSVGVALLCGLFAFAQWKVAGTLVRTQMEHSAEVSRRVAAGADMATHQANAHRATLNILLSRDSKEFEEATAQRQVNLRAYSDASKTLGDAPDLYEAAEKLRLQAAQYEALSEQVIDLFREGRKEDALDLRVRRLRDAFNCWQTSQKDFSGQLARSDERQKDMYDQSVSTSKKWFLVLLLAPVVVIALGVAAMVVIFGLQRFGPKLPDVWSH